MESVDIRQKIDTPVSIRQDRKHGDSNVCFDSPLPPS